MPDLVSMTSWPALLLFLLASSPPFSGGEMSESCTDAALKLKCSETNDTGGAVVVVREAWLYSSLRVSKEWGSSKCHVKEFNLGYKAGSFLQYINKQCGGQAECTFELEKHTSFVDPKTSRKWQGGALKVVYDCVEKTNFHRVCGSEVQQQNGWVQSVGYPLYYLGDPFVCTITLRVDKGQRVQLTLTDVSLREDGQQGENKCRDSVMVTEGGTTLLERCEETNSPIVVISQGPVVNVTLTATSNVFPKRGYVAHFKALGCQTPNTPADGYLSYRNATHAEFWCCVHHVFPDTMTRKRVLQCGDRTQAWNDTITDCLDLEEMWAAGNITEREFFKLVNGSSGGAQAEKLWQAHLVYDLVLPTVIMTVLVLGNAAVVFLIIYCRRGVLENGVRCEELESIKANPEPPDTIDSEPCNV